MNVFSHVKIFEWWGQFLFFLFSIFSSFFTRIDTLIFHSTRCSTNIAIVVFPGVKNRRENKFFLVPCFSLSTKFFSYALTATAHARLEKIFSSVSPPLSLPVFYRHPHHYHYQHYFQLRQCVTITYFWTRKHKCENICMYLSIQSTFIYI